MNFHILLIFELLGLHFHGFFVFICWIIITSVTSETTGLICSFAKKLLLYSNTTLSKPSSFFWCYVSDCLVCMSAFCLFTPFPSVLLVFNGKKLRLIESKQKYMTSTGEYILKKGVVENDFLISGNYSFNV